MNHPDHNRSRWSTGNTEVPGTPPATGLVLLQGHESYLAQVSREQTEASSQSHEQVPPAAQSRSWVCPLRNDHLSQKHPNHSCLRAAGSRLSLVILLFFLAYLPKSFLKIKDTAVLKKSINEGELNQANRTP